MILHIPHSSTDTAGKTFLCERDTELLRMTDWYTDELYSCEGAARIVFPYSRLICDVERFEDDALEAMSKKGMGVVYTHNSFGERLREVDAKERAQIIEKMYRPHHAKLEEAVCDELARKGSALIIDCHSFPDEVLPHHSDAARPDICIGTDAFHTPELLEKVVRDYFEKRGYSVAVNSPFAGSIVPMRHYYKDARVSSLMIELNRRLYMDEKGTKSEGFASIQKEISSLLAWLSCAQFA